MGSFPQFIARLKEWCYLVHQINLSTIERQLCCWFYISRIWEPGLRWQTNGWYRAEPASSQQPVYVTFTVFHFRAHQFAFKLKLTSWDPLSRCKLIYIKVFISLSYYFIFILFSFSFICVQIGREILIQNFSLCFPQLLNTGAKMCYWWNLKSWGLFTLL